MTAIRIIILAALLFAGLLPSAPAMAMPMDHGDCAACAVADAGREPHPATCDHASTCCPAALPLPPPVGPARALGTLRHPMPRSAALPSRASGTDPPPPRA